MVDSFQRDEVAFPTRAKIHRYPFLLERKGCLANSTIRPLFTEIGIKLKKFDDEVIGRWYFRHETSIIMEIRI